ncbi:MAG: alcohol dehydrogenase family protein [Actinomycetota bacterium]
MTHPEPAPDLPATMTAVHLTRHGGPDALEIRHDVPVPRPGPDEALIRVAACGVNNTDVNTRVGWYSKAVTGATSGEGFDEAGSADSTWGGGGVMFPRIQGADPSGQVVAIGAGGDQSLVGRRVLVDPVMRDADDPADRTKAGYLGSERDGGFAEYCCVPATNVHAHASPLDDVTLAALPCSWSTAEHMLQRVRLSEGQSIAVTGASGGVGSALVALAKLRGARVVAVAGASKHDAVAAFGPDELVDRAVAAVPEAAVAANGGPFDVVADVVGGPDFGPWLDALARGGRYVTAGAIAGPVVDLDLRTLYLNDLELYGTTVFGPQVFADLIGYLNDGRITPVVGATYPLADIVAAQEAFERKAHVGAIVLTVSDPAGW